MTWMVAFLYNDARGADWLAAGSVGCIHLGLWCGGCLGGGCVEQGATQGGHAGAVDIAPGGCPGSTQGPLRTLRGCDVEAVKGLHGGHIAPTYYVHST